MPPPRGESPWLGNKKWADIKSGLMALAIQRGAVINCNFNHVGNIKTAMYVKFCMFPHTKVQDKSKSFLGIVEVIVPKNRRPEFNSMGGAVLLCDFDGNKSQLKMLKKTWQTTGMRESVKADRSVVLSFCLDWYNKIGGQIQRAEAKCKSSGRNKRGPKGGAMAISRLITADAVEVNRVVPQVVLPAPSTLNPPALAPPAIETNLARQQALARVTAALAELRAAVEMLK